MVLKPRFPFRQEVFGGILYDTRTEDFFYLNESMFRVLESLDTNYIKKTDFNETRLEGVICDLEGKGLILDVTQKNSSRNLRGRLEHSDISLLSAPTILEIYPTFLCNERCDFCYVGFDIESSRGEKMDPVKIEILAEQAKKAGVFNITILGGEPFLYKHLDRLISSLSDSGLEISLSTNGTVRNNYFLDVIKARDVKLNLALHSSKPEVHEGLTRFKGFNKAISTLEKILEEDISVHITMVLSQRNLGDVEDTVRFLRSLGVQSMTLSYPQPSSYTLTNGKLISFRDYEKAVMIGFSVGEEVGMRVQGSNHYNFLLREYNAGFDEKNPLAFYLYGDKAGRSRLEIMPSGDIYPTSSVFGIDEWKVGNIFEENLVDLWINSQSLKKIRERKLPTKCEECNYRGICGGGIIGNLIEHGRWNLPPADCPLIIGRNALPDLKGIAQLTYNSKSLSLPEF